MIRAFAILAYLAGLFGRYVYILRVHHPRNSIYSDVEQYLNFAHRLLDPGYTQVIEDTIWPPGTSFHLAVQYLLDPSLGLAAWTSFFISAAIPVLIAYAAYLAWGSRACWYALLAGSFHFGFVHYGGFFLSENLFTFLVSLALCLFALSVYRVSGPLSFWAGALCGCVWGAAYAVRAPALPIGMVVVLLISLQAIKSKQYQNIKYLICPTIGFLLITLPLALRCTALSEGKVCLVSNNFALNIALGFAGDRAVLHFEGENGEFPMNWGPPSKIMHEYKSTGNVPTHIFDTAGVMKWVGQQFLHHPIDFLVSAVGNVFDLFNPHFIWPGGFGGLPLRWIWVMQQIFFFVVLIPALVACWKYSKELLLRQTASLHSVYLVAGVLGLMAISFFSMGEPRYRVPFDSFLILLAVSWVAQENARDRFTLNVSLVLAGVLVTIYAGAQQLLIYPENPWRTGLLHTQRPRAVSGSWIQKVINIKDTENGPTFGLWDGPGTTVFTCHISCPEVRVVPGPNGFGHKFVISIDHNDRYAIQFYNNKELKQQITVGPSHNASHGLAVETFSLPAGLDPAQIDQIGIRPLYGDGFYSFGTFQTTEQSF